MYKIYFRKLVKKELKKIDRQFTNNIFDKIKLLQENPYPPNSRKLIDSKGSYRIRVGDYRVIYQVDEEKKEIDIFHIRHRKDAYK